MRFRTRSIMGLKRIRACGFHAPLRRSVRAKPRFEAGGPSREILGSMFASNAASAFSSTSPTPTLAGRQWQSDDRPSPVWP